MKLAMAQMSMTGSMDENLKKSLAFCDAAAGSDLLFFPEVQLTPFFPQYAGRNVDAYVVPAGSPTVQAFADKAKAHRLYLSPNMYLEQEGRRYDASLWLTPEGACAGVAKMVHIMQAAQFSEVRKISRSSASPEWPSRTRPHAFPAPFPSRSCRTGTDSASQAMLKS